MLWAAATVGESRGDVAVSANVGAPSSFSLGLNRTAGWRFTVNSPLAVTHLGLYDWQGDGFEIDYPVAMWKGEGDLLVQAEIPVGAASPLVNGFRYTSVEAASPIVLLPGETYTIGYFQSTLAGSDRAIHFNGFHEMSPMLNQVGGGWITTNPSPSIAIPDQAFLDFQQWFGASFQFAIVPAPGAGAVMVAMLMIGSQRRRDCT